MAKKGTPPKETPGPDDKLDIDDNPENIENPGQDLSDIIPGQQIDDFGEFFQDGQENVVVQIYRIEPKYWKGQRVDGYLGTLEEGSDFDTVKQQYGGERFILRQKVNGKFGRQRTIRIAGPPLVDSPPPAGSAAAKDEPPPSLGDGITPTMQIEGIQVPLNDFEQIKRMMIFIKLLKHCFPDPPDINTTLLEIAIGRGQKQTDILDEAEKFTTLATRLKQLSGDQPTGTGWLDLGIRALDTVEKMASTAGQKRIGVVQAAQPQQIAGQDAGRNAPQAGPENQQQESGNVDQIQLAEKAASYIVAGYIAEPQQTEQETAQALELVLPPMTAEVRQQLKAYEAPLLTIGRNILNSEIETTPEEIEKFSLYYKKVFSIFTGEQQEQA